MYDFRTLPKESKNEFKKKKKSDSELNLPRGARGEAARDTPRGKAERPPAADLEA